MMVVLSLVFFAIAFFYSMAGFGGGSSYLAVMVLAGLPFQEIRSTALMCNILVTVCGFWNFYRAGHFRWEKVLPFVILSVPMAYWGGRLEISEKLFSVLLGFSLLAVALRLFLPDKTGRGDSRHTAGGQARIAPTNVWRVGLPAGGILGFLAGVVGIGGGIFLSPLLMLMRWMTSKEAAAAASFFILVNSLSGLAGQAHHSSFNPEFILPLGAAVLLGGQLGSRWSADQLRFRAVRRLTAVLVLYVSIKLLWGVV